jgi:hypothetical protein
VSGRLTAACSYQHELHRNKSIQRESNPHFRHGKPVGFRYIMDANVLIGLSKNSQFREHQVGLEPTLPHYGCGVLAAERPVPVSEWDQRDLNPHLLG